MRAFFIIGLRLLGIVMLYWALCDIPRLIIAIHEAYTMFPILNEHTTVIGSGWDGHVHTKYIQWLVTRAGLAFVFGLLLLFRTESVLALIPETRGEPVFPYAAPEWLLPTGIRFIGLYAFANTIAWTLGAAVMVLPNASAGQLSALSEFAAAFGQIVVASMMTFFPRHVADFVLTRERESELLRDALDKEQR